MRGHDDVPSRPAPTGPGALPRRSFLGLAAVSVLGLTVAGCGSDDQGSASSTATSDTTATDDTATTGADTASGNGDLQIAMENIQFVPKVATAKVGQKVTWTNEDSVQHDVRALKGAKFQSSLFGKDGSYSFTPKEPGTIAYDCSVHPCMVGVLKVVA